MPEDATIPTKSTPLNGGDEVIQDSHVFNISLRGWLAVLITGTLCFLVLRQIPIDETFKTVAVMAISFYFGQKQSQKEK